MTYLRILHIRTVSGTGGGPDKTILNSCAHLIRAGHLAQIFYILDRRRNSSPLCLDAEKLHIPLHRVFESGPFALSTLSQLDRVLKENNFQIVHTHDYKSTALIRLLRCKRSKSPFKFVATAHGYNRTSLREAIYYALDRFLLRSADAVITPSRDLCEYLRKSGLKSDRLHVIPNGIEISDPPQTPRQRSADTVHLLYLGRLSREKDPVNLLRAMPILIDHGFSIQTIFAGDGPERTVVEKWIQKLNLADKVKMLGYVSDISPLLAEADILVSPSRTECMPNAILEAMAAGLPIVATNVGGVGEMLRDGVDAILCPPRNHLALARALAQLIANQPLARKLAASARHRVAADFSFKSHIQKTLTLYLRLLGTPAFL